MIGLKVKPIKERNPVVVAIVGLAIIVGLTAVAYRADRLPIIGGGTTYSAHFSEAAGLKSDDPVRVAGVKVGKVTGISLDGAKVKVKFRVKDTWIGDASRAAIMIQTLLGEKYLAVDPLGDRKQEPADSIPLRRTVAPYDVTKAFDDLGRTLGELDTDKVAQSLDTISTTFQKTPPSVRKAFDGLSALSRTISSRDAQLAHLLAGSKKVTGVLADQSGNFEALLKDGNLLLAEFRARRQAIHNVLVGTTRMAREISGLINDNWKALRPTLDSLERITDLLRRNQANLDRALSLAGTYNRLLGNALGNGRWMDGYLCGVVPKKYAPEQVPDEGCIPPKQGGR